MSRLFQALAVLRLSEAAFLRYLAASAVALAADVGSLLVLIKLGMPAGAGAAAAYSLGIVVHWVVVSRAVFVEEVADRGPARTRQKVLFVLSALLGLAITTAMVSAGDAMGANVLLTKGAAIGLSFMTNWLVRRILVFRQLTPGV